ncbi:MAG: hypothetical protein OXC55_03115 [Chloroflexi bacterium]|nr:hypothetical protein [Chloroflexota bacterium]
MTQSELLKPLVDAVEIVKRRIEEHGSSLRENETRTRVALIDPILQALGWDVSNPKLVTPEFPVGSGRADYALLGTNGAALVAVEAKRLNESLMSHRQQMVNYANMEGIGHAGLTDGNSWEIYKVFTATPLPLHERLTMSVQLSGVPAYEAALKLLLLWRPNVESRQPQEAELPIAGWPDTESVTSPSPPLSPSEEPSSPAPTVEPTDEGGWVPLESVYSLNGAKVKPQEIRFANGQSALIRNWHDVWVEFGRFVHSNNLLRGETHPLESSTFKKPILGSSKFSETCRQVDNLPIFVEWAANTFMKLKWTEYLAKQLEIGIVKVRLKD